MVDQTNSISWACVLYSPDGDRVHETEISSIHSVPETPEYWKPLWSRRKKPPTLLYTSPRIVVIGYKSTRKDRVNEYVREFLQEHTDLGEQEREKIGKGYVLIARSKMNTSELTREYMVHRINDRDDNTDLNDLFDREGLPEDKDPPPPQSFAHVRNRARELLLGIVSDLDIMRDIERGILRQTIRQIISHGVNGRTWKDPVVKEAYHAIFQKVYRNLAPEGSPHSIGNPRLLELVKNRTIPGKDLAGMEPAKLWPEKWQDMEEARIMKQIATLEATSEAGTDMFQCRKCKERKCVFTEVQTRSADEPMTTFVCCLVCGNKWKE
jgi:hypothetical protein